MTLQSEFAQKRLDANNLIVLLETCPHITPDTRQWCIAALRIHIHSCTPLAGLDEFQETIDNVSRIIELELGE